MPHLSHLPLLAILLPTLLSATPLPHPNPSPVPLPGTPFIIPLDMSILPSTHQLLKRDLGNSGLGAVALVVILFLAVLGFIGLRRNALKREAMRKKLGIPPQRSSQETLVEGRNGFGGRGYVQHGGQQSGQQEGAVMMVPVGLTGMMRVVRPEQQEGRSGRLPVHREQDVEVDGEAPPPAYHEAVGNGFPARMAPAYVPEGRM